MLIKCSSSSVVSHHFGKIFKCLTTAGCEVLPELAPGLCSMFISFYSFLLVHFALLTQVSPFLEKFERFLVLRTLINTDSLWILFSHKFRWFVSTFNSGPFPARLFLTTSSIVPVVSLDPITCPPSPTTTLKNLSVPKHRLCVCVYMFCLLVCLVFTRTKFPRLQ